MPCSCGTAPYIGEHQDESKYEKGSTSGMFTEKNWENSTVALHAQNCQGSIDFGKTKTVKVEYNRFNRKVREALEIQLNKLRTLRRRNES